MQAYSDNTLLDGVTSSLLKAKSFSEKCMQKIFSKPVYIAYLVLFILLQVGLMYWSLEVRLPLLQQTNTLLVDKILLEDTLANKQDEWSSDAINNIEDKIDQAERSVFRDFKHLLFWLLEKQQAARKLGFELDYTLQAVSEEKLNNTFVLPLELQLRRLQSSQDTHFSHLQAYIYQLISDQYHVEVVALDASSKALGLTKLDLKIQLWVHDPDKLLQRQQPSKEQLDAVPFIQ